MERVGAEVGRRGRWRLRLLGVRSRCESSFFSLFLFFTVSLQQFPCLHRCKAGLKEVQMLNKLRQADPEDKKHVVKLERTFEHRGHLCLVFESLRWAGFSVITFAPSLIHLQHEPAGRRKTVRKRCRTKYSRGAGLRSPAFLVDEPSKEVQRDARGYQARQYSGMSVP